MGDLIADAHAHQALRYRSPSEAHIASLESRILVASDIPAAIDAVHSLGAVCWLDQFTEIPEEIAVAAAGYFGVSRDSVRIIGSAQFGFSLLNLRTFCPGTSDLDLAIIDRNLAERMREELCASCPEDTYCIRPDKIGTSDLARRWMAFFHGLQADHGQWFSSVTATIYPDWHSFRIQQLEAYYAFIGIREINRQLPFSQLDQRRATSAFEADRATLADLGRFSTRIDECHTANASPHVVDGRRLRSMFHEHGRRRHLVNMLAHALEMFPPSIKVHHLLIGGSVLNLNVRDPQDLDCLLYYSVGTTGAGKESSAAAASMLRAARWILKAAKIDARFVPVDAGALMIARMTSFMTSLYCASRSGCPTNVGTLLVDLSAMEKGFVES